ncbi:MAG: FAD-binding protein [Proteobacteria bacterium]|nr:FAD-binding protein [Pseudomonadota bacterium]
MSKAEVKRKKKRQVAAKSKKTPKPTAKPRKTPKPAAKSKKPRQPAVKSTQTRKPAAKTRPSAGGEQLIKIFGANRVSDDPMVLQRYGSDLSFSPAKSPDFVVRPSRAEEVKALVEWANRTAASLVPVSSGPPHFRGDTVPGQEGSVVVDLSGMKKILRLDRRNRVAMIEPGVTFQELKPEVEKQGMKLMLPLAPRATKSVIGSCLEREPILVPKYHWDMSDPLCCTEVVFGTGDLFRTGAAAGPGTLEEQWAAGQAQKSPLGPGQTDLFRVVQGAQGTLGILTWATVRLELLPSIQKLYLAGGRKVEELIDLVYGMQRLKLGDECLILNRLDLAAILETQPEEINKLMTGLPPYILIFVVAGYDRFPEERVDYQTKDIMELARKHGVQPVTGLPGVDAGKLLRAISGPSAEPYWKLRPRGNCADIFFLTTLDRAPGFIKVMSEVMEKTGFPASDLGVYLQPIQQGRSCHFEFNLAFAPDDPAGVKRARETFDRASQALLKQGAFFSRPYGSWPEMLRRLDAESVIALKKVKNIFDPRNVMNPGKLFF